MFFLMLNYVAGLACHQGLPITKGYKDYLVYNASEHARGETFNHILRHETAYQVGWRTAGAAGVAVNV